MWKGGRFRIGTGASVPVATAAGLCPASSGIETHLEEQHSLIIFTGWYFKEREQHEEKNAFFF